MNNIVKRHAKVGLIPNYPAFPIADGISKLIQLTMQNKPKMQKKRDNKKKQIKQPKMHCHKNLNHD